MLAACPIASHALDFSTNVTAQGGVAVGRDIRDSTVINGVRPEKLEALVLDRTKLLEDLVASHKDTIAGLKKELDINERQISAALNILGEKDIPPERLAAKLVEIAERFKALQAAGAPQPGDAPEVAQLKREANKAIHDGNLVRADDLLVNLERAQQAALGREQELFNRHALDLAETWGQRGDLALAGLHYLDAAGHFAAAAAHVPREYDDQRLTYLDKEANALSREGDEGVDNEALGTAIEGYRSSLALRLRDRVPLDWARTQNNLGNVLAILGERESGTGRLEQAVTAFNEALKATLSYSLASVRSVPTGLSRQWLRTARRSRNGPASAQHSIGPKLQVIRASPS
jgi:hypothetical protein